MSIGRSNRYTDDDVENYGNFDGDCGGDESGGGGLMLIVMILLVMMIVTGVEKRLIKCRPIVRTLH